MQALDFVFSLVIIVMSVVIHEVSHGYVANMLGDPTARFAGRLTLNPLKHLDPFGSVILPLMLSLSGLPTIGYAVPVPYNPYNLRAGKWGPALVALAGPGSNLALALFFGLLLRFGYPAGLVSVAMIAPLALIVQINLGLAVFNAIPVPPLDGSKLLFALLPYERRDIQNWMEQNQYLLLFVLIFFGMRFIAPVIPLLYRLILGI